MAAIEVRESVQIDLPPREVWTAIADYSFDLQWRRGLQEMTPDPPGAPRVGTKVHEVVRNSGREYVADTVVTELEPGVSYRFSGSGTIGELTGGREVRLLREGAAAEFTYAVELQPTGVMRFARPLLRMIVSSGLRKDLATLKALLERGARPGSAAV